MSDTLLLAERLRVRAGCPGISEGRVNASVGSKRTKGQEANDLGENYLPLPLFKTGRRHYMWGRNVRPNQITRLALRHHYPPVKGTDTPPKHGLHWVQCCGSWQPMGYLVLLLP